MLRMLYLKFFWRSYSDFTSCQFMNVLWKIFYFFEFHHYKIVGRSFNYIAHQVCIKSINFHSLATDFVIAIRYFYDVDNVDKLQLLLMVFYCNDRITIIQNVVKIYFLHKFKFAEFFLS